MNVDDLVFRTRALSQAHPLSKVAERYVNRIIARERSSQPTPEIGIWAGYALTLGYALRKVEEVETLGARLPTRTESPQVLDTRAGDIAAAVRTVGAECYLWDEETVVGALDRLIAGEVERRLDHWRGTVTAATWRELEEYLAWWTVKGYALRVAETSVGDGGHR